MQIIGPVVITVVMLCALLGAIASLRNPDDGLGKEFREGLHAIGYIFVPVAGIMASVPFLKIVVLSVLGPLYSSIGADPAMAGTTFIASDMGGYFLAHDLKASDGGWIMAMMTGFTAGATIVFSIPVGLSLLDKRDHKYMALGILAGLLSIPVGVFISSVLFCLVGPDFCSAPAIGAALDQRLELSPVAVIRNLIPLVLIMSALAVGLRFWPDIMVRGFMAFGRAMNVAITLVLVACIIQYFTKLAWKLGIFTLLFGSWWFDPIIADDLQINAEIKTLARENPAKLAALIEKEELVNSMRALEVAGYIGLMLAGAFPMVYLIQKHLAGPVAKLGKGIGLSPAGAAGLLAAVANILAMFRLVREMPAKDKVLNIAFAVCAAFLFGDHLAFTTNFQRGLLPFVMAGKLGGGIVAFLLAYWLCVPKAIEMERADKAQESAAAA